MRRPALYTCTVAAAIGWALYYAASRLANARRANVLALRPAFRPKITVDSVVRAFHPREVIRERFDRRFRPERAGVA